MLESRFFGNHFWSNLPSLVTEKDPLNSICGSFESKYSRTYGMSCLRSVRYAVRRPIKNVKSCRRGPAVTIKRAAPTYIYELVGLVKGRAIERARAGGRF